MIGLKHFEDFERRIPRDEITEILAKSRSAWVNLKKVQVDRLWQLQEGSRELGI